MVETKEISELTRSNRIAMLAHISTVTVMVFFMIWESVRGQLSPVYMTIATVVGVIPLIGEVICWKSNTEHAMIKHLVSYGFSLFYTICLFTSPTNLIYVFVIPMIFVVTTYSDTRYLLLINTGTILESIIVVVIGATKGGFGYHGIEAAVVQIVVMIMVGAYSVLTTKVIRENTRKRFTEVAQAKAEAENLLERNEELDQQLSGNIADINVRFEKLTAASKTTTEAMQEVSAGATDTAEHVQNQLEQTHAIQDKVDEVATAVEEIGNSMTLTLKALAEGKQDIEHLASEVEASVDNGTEVTEKLENLNQYMDEMNSIVELIGGITNQTSLLALNASIEAARAGEAGRGFSVVATEISGMATRTKEATVHITELISNVSNAIMEVVGVVSNMINGINEEKTGASNAEESFESIEDNTRAIQKNADTLSRSISELQNANKEIIDSIQTISAISQQVSAHAGETMQAEEENLNVMQDVSAIMQKLATLAAHS